MSKFIRLTTLRRNNEPIVLNIDTIEYMLPIAGSNGTALISTTHHTKYEVQESMDDILELLQFNGMVITDPRKMKLDIEAEFAEETPSAMEVKENEDHYI